MKLENMFLSRIIYTWNSLPDFLVNVDSIINIFKNHLDTFWSDQVKILCFIIQLNLPESEIDHSL